jgi:hypothetical protein
VAETLLEVTPEMIEAAARELVVQDAADHLRDCYGLVTMKRARRFADAMLHEALRIRFDA